MIKPIWPWAIFFKRLLSIAVFGICFNVSAGGFPSADDALAGLFPESASWSRKTLVLTPEEKKQIAEVTNQRKPLSLVAQYEIRNEDEIIGFAYLDRHRVRTLPEILLVTLSKAGEVLDVQVLAFREPMEYLAKPAWYAQFVGMMQEDKVRMKRNIDGITGATLTARAGVQAVRRTLAVHQLLLERTP